MLTKQEILKILDWDKTPTLDDSSGLLARITKVAREAERQEREACREIAAQYSSCEGIAQKIEQEIRGRGEL